MQKNGGAEKYILERIRRATIAMKMTSSIGERLFRDDYKRKMKMFKALVDSVALYGAEKERRNKIEEPNYNSLYKKTMLEEVPGYLQGKKKRKGIMM